MAPPKGPGLVHAPLLLPPGQVLLRAPLEFLGIRRDSAPVSVLTAQNNFAFAFSLSLLSASSVESCERLGPRLAGSYFKSRHCHHARKVHVVYSRLKEKWEMER